MPEVDSRPGEQPHGFEVKSVTPIDELRAVTTELAHQHSGHACYMSIVNLRNEAKTNSFRVSINGEYLTDQSV